MQCHQITNHSKNFKKCIPYFPDSKERWKDYSHSVDLEAIESIYWETKDVVQFFHVFMIGIKWGMVNKCVSLHTIYHNIK